jgi:hypothetical protein
MWLVPLMVTPVHAKSAQTPVHTMLQDIQVAADQSIQLADTASAAPHIYGSYRRFGLYDSTPISLPSVFDQVQVVFQQNVPTNTLVRVDVRALDQDEQWSEWHTSVANGDTLRFKDRMRVVQYRAILLSNSVQSPTLSRVSFVPSTTGVRTRSKTNEVAPTYRLRATRQGMVGGRTANGHIIEPNDFFVSLPSDRALSSRGGEEYLVRLSANGRSIVVPVWDNGPWNHNDDFWNKDRERYRDLPVGWPQDHAAYYENHNKGQSERGKVRYPSAVDIADGAYWALGLNGAQATVNVTFLWLGEDPGPSAAPLNTKPSERPSRSVPRTPVVAPSSPPPTPAPSQEPAPDQPTTPPLPPEPAIEVNDTDQAFRHEGAHWGFTVNSCAHGGQARSVETVAREDAVNHQAVWRPTVRGGTYDVYAYVPTCAADRKAASIARYVVHHAEGDSFITQDQSKVAGKWVMLGRFSFAPGSDGYVQLRNVSASNEEIMWFDAVKWVPVNQ